MNKEVFNSEIQQSAKIMAEIDKVKAKIGEQQARLKSWSRSTEAENEEIVDIVGHERVPGRCCPSSYSARAALLDTVSRSPARKRRRIDEEITPDGAVPVRWPDGGRAHRSGLRRGRQRERARQYVPGWGWSRWTPAVEQRDPQPFTPDGTGTVVNATSEDGKEVFTITTADEAVFYLVIDRQRSAENVYFLNAVTVADLMALAETGPGAGGPAPVLGRAGPGPDRNQSEPEKSAGQDAPLAAWRCWPWAAGPGGISRFRPKRQKAAEPEEDLPAMTSRRTG